MVHMIRNRNNCFNNWCTPYNPGDTVRLTTASLRSYVLDNFGSIRLSRASIMAGAELLVEATTHNIQINVGASPGGQQYEHRWVSATANAVQEETIPE